jgi:DNA gyrase subunit B
VSWVLNNSVKFLRLKDERTGKEDDFTGADGVKGFVDFISKGKTVLNERVCRHDDHQAIRA